MNIISNLIFHSNNCDANRAFVTICSKSAISLQWGPANPKFQVEGVAPTNHSSSQKTRLNDLSYGIKIGTDLSSVLLLFTRLTDGRTDRRTDTFLIASPRWHSMRRVNYIPGHVRGHNALASTVSV